MKPRECDKYDACLSNRRGREYRKAYKRINPRLRDTIDSEIHCLRTDPRRGAEPAQDLAGMRSIHIDRFSYRTVYRVDNDACTITVEGICHRKPVCARLKRRQGG